ncbi:MAG: hypothetical protein ACRDDY_13255 [Clostridium sp.]|uniref:hypothetical protein n=1 Tax=Clostridium sp. TaxID=1506 RepID=UPI003EE6749B
MKNAMFQFYDGKGMVDDTGLIDLDEALKMFENRKDAFAESLGNDLQPQMAIWINCSSVSDYHTTLKDWCAGDVKYEDGCFWVRE